MKNTTLSLLLGFLAFAVAAPAAFAQQRDFDSPYEYFDFLNSEHGAIIQRNMEYVQHSVHSQDPRQVEEKRVNLVAQLAQAVVKVGGISPFDKDDQMHGEMMAVLKTYVEAFELEFKEVNRLKDQSLGSYEAMSRYLDAQTEAEKKLALAGRRFLTAQRKFAKAHNIQLVEGEGNPEIEQLNRLNQYQRGIFLRDFGVLKLDAAFWSAVQSEDLPAMERTRSELERKADQSAKQMRMMPDFNGNTAYRDAAIKGVEFMLQMAQGPYQGIIKSQRNKSRDKLTQEDVDAYNEAVSRYNTEAPANAQALNEALNQLLRDNVPKPAVATKRI